MRYTLFFPSSLFPFPSSLLPAPCSLKTRNLYLTSRRIAIFCFIGILIEISVGILGMGNGYEAYPHQKYHSD
ncbi:MAG: hypothetical protein F6K65_40540 [Moorea sp. SIO3C2]|nr:hypothetical protein [Moorena sp. SIO3C2]